jgi:hypothetical protein
MFENIDFVKADIPHVKEFDAKKSPCVMFRKKFAAPPAKSAKVHVCGLGRIRSRPGPHICRTHRACGQRVSI